MFFNGIQRLRPFEASRSFSTYDYNPQPKRQRRSPRLLVGFTIQDTEKESNPKAGLLSCWTPRPLKTGRSYRPSRSRLPRSAISLAALAPPALQSSRRPALIPCPLREAAVTGPRSPFEFFSNSC